MKHKPRITVLGGGLSGLAFAHFLDGPVTILEKEATLGGLCRSFPSPGGGAHDLGPHIFFSKNSWALDFFKSLCPMRQVRRVNKVWHDGRFVKYPFENDLYSLSDAQRQYCLETFLKTSDEPSRADNMQDWFRETFGDGISGLYLEPYNRKVWKREPSELDTQMVSRIPKPPRDHIIRSARGEITEGYTHQLHFWYPERGGCRAMIDGLVARTPNAEIRAETVEWPVTPDVLTNNDVVVSTIPLKRLVRILEVTEALPTEVERAVSQLRYVSVLVTAVEVTKSALEQFFAVYVPDPSVSFHRVTNLGFLGPNYRPNDGSWTLLVETTVRPDEVLNYDYDMRVVNDLVRIGFISSEQDVCGIRTRLVPRAYPVYTLAHRQTVDTVLRWVRSLGIYPLGRSGTWEYMNMDACLVAARDLAEELKAKL